MMHDSCYICVTPPCSISVLHTKAVAVDCLATLLCYDVECTYPEFLCICLQHTQITGRVFEDTMKHAISVTDSLLQRFIKRSATVLRKETITAKQEDLLIRELTTVQPYTEQQQRHFADFLRRVVNDTYSSCGTTNAVSSDDNTTDHTVNSNALSKRSNSVAQYQLNEAQIHAQVVSVTRLIIAGYCKLANMVSEGQSLAAYKIQAVIKGRATRAILHSIWLVSVKHYQYRHFVTPCATMFYKDNQVQYHMCFIPVWLC